MAQDPLACLEKRLSTLEQNIYGDYHKHGIEASGDNMSIIDSLVQSNMMTSSAMSGRDKLGTIVKRLDLLEKVLDPLYEDSVIDSVAKVEYILFMEEELKTLVQSLNKVGELSPILHNEQFKKIPNLTKQLAHLTMLTLETKKSQESVTENITSMITKYSDIFNGVSTLIASLEATLTHLEINAQPKKMLD